jgi:hypothetical protein
MIASLHVWEQFAWVLILLAAAGCSRGDVATTRGPAEERLLALGTAYQNAARRLGHPPKDFQELKPSLEGDASEDFLRSPNDGEPFVVIWGVDFDKLPQSPAHNSYVVAIYEKKGAGGKRCVLRFPLSTCRLTHDQWKKAVFPPGYTPPP